MVSLDYHNMRKAEQVCQIYRNTTCSKWLFFLNQAAFCWQKSVFLRYKSDAFIAAVSAGGEKYFCCYSKVFFSVRCLSTQAGIQIGLLSKQCFAEGLHIAAMTPGTGMWLAASPPAQTCFDNELTSLSWGKWQLHFSPLCHYNQFLTLKIGLLLF